jgi:hypothetical protein
MVFLAEEGVLLCHAGVCGAPEAPLFLLMMHYHQPQSTPLPPPAHAVASHTTASLGAVRDAARSASCCCRCC